MAYLLRYCHYPATAAELCKMASTKNFPRLQEYFEDVPAEATYRNAAEALRAFKAYGVDSSDDQ